MDMYAKPPLLILDEWLLFKAKRKTSERTSSRDIPLFSIPSIVWMDGTSSLAGTPALRLMQSLTALFIMHTYQHRKYIAPVHGQFMREVHSMDGSTLSE